MIFCDDCGDVHEYEYGDRVRLVQNHMLTGQIIDEQGWGQKYQVRVGSTVSAIWFDVCELEPDPDFILPDKAEMPPVVPADDGSNVIAVNFKAARAVGGVH